MVGTRVDVQPYLALDKGLQRAGHIVAIATDPAFADLVAASGLTLAPRRHSFICASIRSFEMAVPPAPGAFQFGGQLESRL